VIDLFAVFVSFLPVVAASIKARNE
jgi:hypothetical protein